ncbi:endogenous retrovirus group K member 8 Gag polyprotein-like [Oryx dammah]|uniref:endogenous retrovirus group K member 8 Gag polyprotein-like n=1 Tax=Oryx dammah TaxID=59534 RepID=UPI001A9B0264|nr:endogenous retrovirus group K member 8 Gag polyprotein-like [Oryx dammah]
MGNSPSLKSQYMELVKGLLHSIGIKTSTRRLSELFCLIEQHCYWFQYQTKVQLNLKEWKVVQKELRKQHQKGNVIPLRLWALCSAITQALKLMAADSEAGSCSLEEGASPRPPPKPPDDSTDSFTETDRDASSGEDSDSVEAMTAAFRKALSNRKRTSKAVNPSAPPYASLFPVAADKAEVGRESRWFWKYRTKYILGNAY